MTRTDYKIDWLAYSYPEDNMMSSDGDIAEKFRGIDLSADRFSSGGIPLLVKGSTAYVNPENENTVIFGETGSKKTRCAILPLIAATAGARESAFITDVKGELSANKKLHNYLEKCGIKTVYLDFRNFFGDGYIDPVSGTLTAEEASLNSDSDVLPQEAMETVTRRLMSLFAADDTTDDGQEDDS